MPFVHERLGAVAEVELVVSRDFGGVEEVDMVHDFADFGELGAKISVRKERWTRGRKGKGGDEG